MNVTDAIRRAQDEEDRTFRETHWSDALSSSSDTSAYGGVQYGSRIVDSRVVAVNAPPESVFPAIERIGGVNGWYYGKWLWRVRGFLDRMVGGVGMQRGRRDPERLRVGDVLDCWRVEAIERPQKLLLRSEMKVFGRAWLQFEVDETDSGSSIRQTAVYDPLGLTGLAYWYSLYFLHGLVFGGMLHGISRAVTKNVGSQEAERPVKASVEHHTLPSGD